MKTNLYTDGGEFTLPDGQRYVGYYNIRDNGESYTERSFDAEVSVLLTRIPTDIITYDSIRSEELGFAPTPVVVSPTEDDYKQMWMYRYFAQRRNNVNAPIIEVDEPQYDSWVSKSTDYNYQLYKIIRLRWKIAGPIQDVYENGRLKESGVADTNRRTVASVKSEMKNIDINLNNLLQFYERDTSFFDAYTFSS